MAHLSSNSFYKICLGVLVWDQKGTQCINGCMSGLLRIYKPFTGAQISACWSRVSACTRPQSTPHRRRTSAVTAHSCAGWPVGPRSSFSPLLKHSEWTFPKKNACYLSLVRKGKAGTNIFSRFILFSAFKIQQTCFRHVLWCPFKNRRCFV